MKKQKTMKINQMKKKIMKMNAIQKQLKEVMRVKSQKFKIWMIQKYLLPIYYLIILQNENNNSTFAL